MQSKLFSQLDISRSDEFQKDFLVLSAFDPEIIRQIPAFAISVAIAPSERETADVVQTAVEALNVPRAQLQHGLAVAQFFLYQFLPSEKAHDDEPVNLITDLNELFEVEPNDERDEALCDFLTQLKQRATTTLDIDVNRKQYAHASLPNLLSVTFTVNLRAVFDEKYKLGTELSKYDPKCVGIVPLGIIQLRLDEGPNERVFFQADRRTIRILIEHLQALEHQLDVAQKDLGLEEAAIDGS